MHRFAGHSIDYDMIAKVANLSFLLPWTSGMTFLQARAVPIMPLRAFDSCKVLCACLAFDHRAAAVRQNL